MREFDKICKKLEQSDLKYQIITDVNNHIYFDFFEYEIKISFHGYSRLRSRTTLELYDKSLLLYLREVLNNGMFLSEENEKISYLKDGLKFIFIRNDNDLILLSVVPLTYTPTNHYFICKSVKLMTYIIDSGYYDIVFGKNFSKVKNKNRKPIDELLEVALTYF